MNNQQPTWQPISTLPMILVMVDGQLEAATVQFNSLLQAEDKPYILDNFTVDRVLSVYKEQLDFMWVFEKQLSKWLEEEQLTASEIGKINKTKDQLKELSKVIADILSLADKLKKGTIEKVLEKSDLEIGLEFFKK